MNLLKIEGLRKLYDLEGADVKALDCINLEVSEGEFIVIVGRSGSGKTTLLRILAGLETKTSGLIEFRDEQVDAGHVLPIGMVFQEPRLLPWLNVEKNILFPFLASGEYRTLGRKSLALLEMLGLENYRNAMPWQLSGGMAQRVALGRALSGDPAMVLLDEPLGLLDYFTRSALQNELVKLYQGGGKTFIMVTHDVTEALLMATRVLVLERGKITRSFAVDMEYPRRRDDMRLQRQAVEVLSAIGNE